MACGPSESRGPGHPDQPAWAWRQHPGDVARSGVHAGKVISPMTAIAGVSGLHAHPGSGEQRRRRAPGRFPHRRQQRGARDGRRGPQGRSRSPKRWRPAGERLMEAEGVAVGVLEPCRGAQHHACCAAWSTP